MLDYPCRKPSQWLRAGRHYVWITRVSERKINRDPQGLGCLTRLFPHLQHWHTQSVLIISVLPSTLHYSEPPEKHWQTKQTLREPAKSWEPTSQKDWVHNEAWVTAWERHSSKLYHRCWLQEILKIRVFNLKVGIISSHSMCTLCVVVFLICRWQLLNNLCGCTSAQLMVLNIMYM